MLLLLLLREAWDGSWHVGAVEVDVCGIVCLGERSKWEEARGTFEIECFVCELCGAVRRGLDGRGRGCGAGGWWV